MINILVSQSFYFMTQRNEARDFIDIRLVKFLNKCNLNVIPVPNSLANLKGLLKMKYIKGVVLSGGNDIFYDNLKKKDLKKNKKLRENRNLVEKKIYLFAKSRNIPIVGICRGFQFLNIQSGGKIKKINKHVATKHKIMILKEKKYQDFKKLLNKNVNSFHNYGINKYQLAKNFYPLALSQNYVEAAISLKNKQFGIMWHPEREKIFNQKDIKIFRKFFRA